jgi:hypothetical protein
VQQALDNTRQQKLLDSGQMSKHAQDIRHAKREIQNLKQKHQIVFSSLARTKLLIKERQEHYLERRKQVQLEQ